MSGATARRNVLGVSRRGRALPINPALWILLWAAAVIVAHAATAENARALGEYWTGTISLILFVALGWYSIRKRTLWFSVRMLRTTARFLPQSLQRRMVLLDRLETWRAVHITLGIVTILPLWWHVSRGLMSPLEALLSIFVVLLFLSGMFGIAVQDFLPPIIQMMPEHEVRLQDVDARIDAVYVEAEEKVLGHSEALVQAYLKDLKPMLQRDRSARRGTFLWATVARRNPGTEICAEFYSRAGQFGDQASTWRELVDLAARKINLEHNAFNLRFSTGWLDFHIVLAVCTFGLLALHVVSALYFYGL